MNENEQINTQMGNNFQPKKKNILIWLIPVILVLVIGIGVLAGYFYFNKPEKFYQRFVGTMIESLTKQETDEVKDFESIRGAIKLDLDVQLEENQNSEVLELINGIELELDAKMNKNDKKLVLDVNAEYDNNNLLDAQLFANAEDKKAYIYAKEFLDKYLEVDMESEDFNFWEEIEEVEETEILTLGQKINLKKCTNIMKKEFSKTVKAEYCSAEQATLVINEKDVKATKNTIKMTLEQLSNEFAIVFGNLKGNEAFLDAIKDEYRNEMIDILEENEKNLKELAEREGIDEIAIKINTYTTGLNKDVVKIEIVLLEEEKEVCTIVVTKIDEQKAEIELITEEKETVIKGTFSVKNVSEKGATVNLATEIKDVGNFEIDLGYEVEYDVEIKGIDEDKVTNINELTDAESLELLKNL